MNVQEALHERHPTGSVENNEDHKNAHHLDPVEQMRKELWGRHSLGFTDPMEPKEHCMLSSEDLCAHGGPHLASSTCATHPENA